MLTRPVSYSVLGKALKHNRMYVYGIIQWLSLYVIQKCVQCRVSDRQIYQQLSGYPKTIIYFPAHQNNVIYTIKVAEKRK